MLSNSTSWFNGARHYKAFFYTIFFELRLKPDEQISKFARKLQESLAATMPGIGGAEQSTLLRGQLARGIPAHLRALIHFNSECSWDELVDKLDKSLIEIGDSIGADSSFFPTSSIKSEPVEAN